MRKIFLVVACVVIPALWLSFGAERVEGSSENNYRHTFGQGIPINTAIFALRQELEARPDHHRLRISLVVLLAMQMEQTGGWQKEKFDSSDPKDLEKMAALALLHFREGNLAKAQEYLELAIKEKIAFPIAYNTLAYIYGKTGQLDKAIALLEKGKARWNSETPFYFNQAFNYIVQENKDKAIHNMETVVQRNAQDEEGLFLLGGLYLAEKRYAEGRHTLEKLLEFNPQHVHSILQLALLSHIEGNTETAFALIEKAGTIDPHNQENIQLIRQYQDGIEKDIQLKHK